MDNKPLEKEALDLIKSRVAKYNFNYSEPNYDKDGVDFFILEECGNNIFKAINCQSKGRDISIRNSQIKIKKNYVQDDFILFLYLKNDNLDEEPIYLFLKEDITNWKVNDESYCLNIPKDSIERKKIEKYYFNKKRSCLINEMLLKTDRNVKSTFITNYSDLNNLHILWKETGSIPDSNLTYKLVNDFDDYDYISLKSLLFLLCINIYNEEKNECYYGIDWSFQYLKTFNDVQSQCQIENINIIKRYFSNSAITYHRTFLELINHSKNNELIDGFRLVIGDSEEEIECYLFRDGNYSLKYRMQHTTSDLASCLD